MGQIELLQPPHEGLLEPLQPISSIPDFVGRYFFCAIDPTYAYRIRDELRLKHRQDNFFVPPELILLKRLWLMAAEYGFPDVGEHLVNHRVNEYQKPATDPLHLIAALIHLAKRNSVLSEKKQAIIGQYNLFGFHEIEVRDFFVRNHKEEEKVTIEFPISYPQLYPFSRVSKNLPILVPDRERYLQLAQFNFTGKDAERMSAADLKSTDSYPALRNAILPICDIDNVLVV